MTHSCSYFQRLELARKLNDKWHNEPGCHGTPFFNIPLENIITDELLMLRITDRLEEGLIMDIVKWDEVTIKNYIITKSMRTL